MTKAIVDTKSGPASTFENDEESHQHTWTRKKLSSVFGPIIIVTSILLVWGNSFHVLVATDLINTLLLTLSLNIVVGNLGLLSFAHGVFFGIGAYASAILATQYGLNPWLCLPFALFGILIAAALLAFPAVRLRGIFFAVATLAFAAFFEVFIRDATSITQGPSGISEIPVLRLFGWDIRGGSMLVLQAVVLAASLVLIINVSESRLGREFSAVRDNPVAAAASGIPVARTRLIGITFSAVIAGVAGWLYAFSSLFVVADIVSLERTFFWFFMVLIGGAGSIFGVCLGTIVLSLIPQMFGFATSQEVLISGIIMLLVVLFAPRGLSGMARLAVKRWRREI